MCGIIGVAKKDKNAVDEAYAGLKRLEYRGYDSVGLAVCDGENISAVKKCGGVEALAPYLEDICGRIAIGHTRWATHGKPSDINAHPHICGKFALVHNGMIENYQSLKDELCAAGESFLSDTDSEVIVKLIDVYYSGDFLRAVAAACRRLKGSYALAILCSGESEIVGVKYKSPAVVGVSEDGAYISSDLCALPKDAKCVYFPKDGDIFSVKCDGVRFFDSNLNPVKRVGKAISLGQFKSDKGKFPHFMRAEIAEDGRTVRKTCQSVARFVGFKKIKRWLDRADRIILTGCGSAYNAALAAKRFFNARGYSLCFAEIAGELRYNLPPVTPLTVVFAVSQSGETADTVGAAEALKAAGARVIAVTNCGFSAITRVADMVVPVCAGAEVCVAATKSYIGQLAALYLISSCKSAEKACADLNLVAKSYGKIFAAESRAKEIAAECVRSSAVFFLGRGADYDSAVEASLKLKEVSYIFSSAYPAGELKHGTLALIDDKTLSVFIVCDSRLAEKCVNAVEQVTSRGGKAAVITTRPQVEEVVHGRASCWLLPKCDSQVAPMLSAAALQLIAYHAAVLCGKNPDKPRNLAKSVTVE